MVKVLVANKNIKKDFNDYDFLFRNNDFEIETSCTGMETIEKYKISKPNIIILDTNISDVPYTDVIDRISMFAGEECNNNMLLTTKNKEDKLILENTSNIFKIIDSPPYTDKIQNEIYKMKNKFERPKIDIAELRYLFFKLDLETNSIKANYMISAICKAYYYSQKYSKFNNLLSSIAKEQSVSENDVRNKLRAFISPLTFSKNSNNKYFLKIFGLNNNITPKNFIDSFAFYMLIKNSKFDK